VTAGARKPQAFKLDAAAATKPHLRHRAPSSFAIPKIDWEPDAAEAKLQPTAPQGRRIVRRFRWAGLLITALGALVSLWAGLALTRLVEDLFARSLTLGWLGAGLLALAALSALAIIMREITGLIRLKKLGDIHDDATRAANFEDEQAGGRAIARLEKIYTGRADVKAGLEDLKSHAGEIISPSDRIRLAERDIMGVLDENAAAIIARHARRVTLLTAVAPAAALDILFVAAVNLRMLRELATLYGGRPGTIGTFRLARMVAGHLAVTGGLALGDNIIQHVIGRGLIGRLSARFGEGAVNGILTARIGLAALDLCRPLPFLTRPRPSLASFSRELLSFGNKPKENSDDTRRISPSSASD
jgi:putative membrane protein